jgi:hypothetical protein
MTATFCSVLIVNLLGFGTVPVELRPMRRPCFPRGKLLAIGVLAHLGAANLGGFDRELHREGHGSALDRLGPSRPAARRPGSKGADPLVRYAITIQTFAVATARQPTRVASMYLQEPLAGEP